MHSFLRPLVLLPFLLAPDGRAAEPAYPTTMAGLPDAVRETLERRYDGTADVGGPFSQWCRRKAGTFHARLLWAEVRPETVLVRYEKGGLAGPRVHIAEFAWSGGGWIEVVQHTRLTWSGKPRAFGTVATAP